ncbi:MAG: DNA repair protein RecO [Tatlockia sp.]|nr:DNA repair protein RecO [Tatlockia sp.]
MTTESLEAWFLHKTPSGDSSTRVSFFTREKGIINCLYKGGRTPKKQALLQPFSSLWLALDIRKDWYYLRHVEEVACATRLKGSAVFAGLYVNELLYYALRPMDSQPELFAVYLQAMQGLSIFNEQLAIEIVLRRFESALLQACGYSLAFNSTVHPTMPINPLLYYQYIAGEGFRQSDQGFSGSDLLALAEGRLDELSVLKTAKTIMRQAINHLLGGKVLKSRSLYLPKDALACKSLIK